MYCFRWLDTDFALLLGLHFAATSFQAYKLFLYLARSTGKTPFSVNILAIASCVPVVLLLRTTLVVPSLTPRTRAQ